MKIEPIDYYGKNVGFHFQEDGKTFILYRKRYGQTDYCPICGEGFTQENTTSVVLTISNQVNVPNRYCHSECFGADASAAFDIIARDYVQFLSFKETYKGWMND